MAEKDEYLKKTKQYYDVRFGYNTKEAGAVRPTDQQRWDYIERGILEDGRYKGKRIKLLDFGCGTGWMAHLLARYGDAYGADVSDEAIAAAGERYGDAKFACVDATAPVEEVLGVSRFDIIISSEVLEHVLYQEAYFRNMVNLLADDGLLLLTTPNGQWKKAFFIQERVAWAQPYELWMTPGELRALGEKYFTDVKVRSFYAPWLFRLFNKGLFLTIIGSPFLTKFLNLLNLKKKYVRLLEKNGFGIYLFMECRKKRPQLVSQ